MNKKQFGLLMAVCSALSVFGVTYIIQSGIFERYPEPTYLSAEEEEFRTVYRQLSKKEKAIYTALYRGVNNYREQIALPYEISGDTYSKIYCILEKQEGGLFYIDSNYYTAKKLRKAKIIYRSDKKEIKDMQRKFEVAAKEALSDAELAFDEYGMAIRIHDYIIRNCQYIEENDSGYCSTAYGCLVQKEANCEGYAKAFNLLAARMGLESVLVTGKTDEGENHAWNQVKIDGEWYNLDVTWDDTDVENDIRRIYFLCDDNFFGKTHFPDEEYVGAYDCEDAGKNYYIKNGLYADSEQAVEEILRREVASGKTQAEIMFSDEKLYSWFKQKYIEEQAIFGILYMYSDGAGDFMSISIEENEKECCITVVWG
ncbi:MAG: hypothetical protein IKK47_03780 [Ruminococcus sp.]|nr:hypothetical protein [Ruminococcus sp.]